MASDASNGREESPYAWDVFISYASEDRESVAVPLARLLAAAGLRVWLDQQELRLGDSLRARIDDGLARSRFGVAVISPRFLEKHWTTNELDALFSSERDRQTRVLPIWHLITSAEVARRSPLLAGRVAASTTSGLSSVAQSIVSVVISAADSPSVMTPSLHLRFLNLLSETRQAEAVMDFLAMHPAIVRTGVGGHPDDVVLWRIRTSHHYVHCAVCTPKTFGRDWNLVQFTSPHTAPVSTEGTRAPEVVQCIEALDVFRASVARRHTAALRVMVDLDAHFKAVVVAGRRESLTSEQLQLTRDWNTELYGLHIRTYDWLADACGYISRPSAFRRNLAS